MKKITSYVKAKTDRYLAIHDEFLDELKYSEFSNFLSSSGEKYYKNQKMLSFFQNINTYIAGLQDALQLIEILDSNHNRLKSSI